MTNELRADQMMARPRPRAAGVVFGLMLVVLGLLWTLDRMDVAPIDNVGRIWPLALVGAGTAKMWDSWDTPARGSGIGLVMTGLWFLAVNFRIFGLTIHNALPLIIVGVGITILLRAFLEMPGGSGSDRKEINDGR